MVIAVGVLFAFVTMLSWGTADFFAKRAVDKIGYVPALLINQSIALAPICFFALVSSSLPVLSADMLLIILVTGMLGLTGYFYMYKGFKKGNLSVVSPISASWFIVTTLIATLIFAEAITPLRIIAIVNVFIGVFLTSTNLSEFRHSIRQVKYNGVQEALLSMVAWGFAFAFIKPIVDVAGPIIALMFSRLIAGSTLFLWVEATKTKILRPSRAILIILLITGLLDAL